MRLRLPFENRLFRAAVLLAFLGCLVGGASLLAQTAPNGYLNIFSSTSVSVESSCAVEPLPLILPDSFLTGRAEIGVPDEFEVAIEDEASVELFRVDTPRRVFRVDQLVITPEATSTIGWSQHPDTSPPLLV
jgi:hypothetical protein